VLDVRGRAVRTLHDGALEGGEFTWPWSGEDDDGRDVPNGVYLVIVDAGSDRSARKIVLAR
ncbi:MAG TPA: FlgD immunoglobulin-like domain containing protein, partial [Candidatus Eisenbacteria bacterium]